MGKIYVKTGDGSGRKLSFSSFLSHLCIVMMSLLGYSCSTPDEPDGPTGPDSPDNPDQIQLMYGTVNSSFGIKSMVADDPSLEPDSVVADVEDNN